MLVNINKCKNSWKKQPDIDELKTIYKLKLKNLKTKKVKMDLTYVTNKQSELF